MVPVHAWNLIVGPDLYSTHKPRRPYEANFLEGFGDKLLYFSNLIRALIWPTSPIWLYYCATRRPFTWDNSLYYIKLILIYHFVAYSARTVGRSFNSTYRQFINDYSEAVISYQKGSDVSKQLRNYDFQIQENSPVSFVAKPNLNLWYLTPPAANIHGSFLSIWIKKIVAFVCVHTFGRRMLYPGSLGILKTLLFQHVSSNRLKLILEQNGERWQLKSSDGNIIDGILFDRREVFPDAPLIICCDGNGGFYETGILKTPSEMDFSVLGFNPPGFSESTGTPYPQNILNSMDAVMQFAFSRGFTEDNIILFGWSIGGFPATWACANYPGIRGLILDASFDHVLPLAFGAMPSFASEIVELAIHEYFNLDVSSQLKQYNGPVRIVRRFNDEVVTSYHGPNELRRRRENRGNYLLANFLQNRYPNVMKNESDTNAVFNFLDMDAITAAREAREALRGYEYEFILENDDLRQNVVKLLCHAHFHDVQATHVAPLKPEEFIIPKAVNIQNFQSFLNSIDNM